jgi:hypothetical protein
MMEEATQGEQQHVKKAQASKASRETNLRNQIINTKTQRSGVLIRIVQHKHILFGVNLSTFYQSSLYTNCCLLSPFYQ